jgi:pyrroline-5-carboxylate reductase
MHPELIEVSDSNEHIVSSADIVFIGLLPGVAREQLPTLPWGPKNKLVVSMMAAVNFEEVLTMTKQTPSTLVKIVPIPSCAKRSGPILQFPGNAIAQEVLSLVGTPIVCSDETQMKPMICLTGHISPFFDLMRVTQDFLSENGTYMKHLL